MSGKNFSLNAAWRMTRLDHQGYLDHERGNVSPYASIEGFNVETVAYDLLHNVFLGVGRDLYFLHLASSCLFQRVFGQILAMTWTPSCLVFIPKCTELVDHLGFFAYL